MSIRGGFHYFQGLLIPFIGTSGGAACVFLLKNELGRNLQRALTGLLFKQIVHRNHVCEDPAVFIML